MSVYDAILFDFDGVLVDSEPVHFTCWRDVTAPFGVKLDWDSYSKELIGITDREAVEWMASHSDPPVDPEKLWALYPAKKAMFRERMLAAPPFAPGLAGFLEGAGHYKLGVVSSSARSEVEPLLEAGGLRRHFDTVICGDDVTRHKPAPEPYLLAAGRVQAQRPLVVEDSDPGIRSGRAAGFDVIQIRDISTMCELVAERLRNGRITKQD